MGAPRCLSFFSLRRLIRLTPIRLWLFDFRAYTPGAGGTMIPLSDCSLAFFPPPPESFVFFTFHTNSQLCHGTWTVPSFLPFVTSFPLGPVTVFRHLGTPPADRSLFFFSRRWLHGTVLPPRLLLGLLSPVLQEPLLRSPTDRRTVSRVWLTYSCADRLYDSLF